MSPPLIVAPSLLAADFAQLPQQCTLLNTSVADWYHLDVMDGRFVPNFTFGIMMIEAFNRLTEKPLDVHLMMVEPERYLSDFCRAGADILTVHYEACPHLHRTVQHIKELGAKAGVALNPHTPVSVLYDLIEDLDLVCLMAVNPGFGGQQFIYRTLQKIRELRQLIIERNAEVHIEVDGGVGLHNAEVIVQAGADVLVAGNAVFQSPDPLQVIAQLKALSPHAVW